MMYVKSSIGTKFKVAYVYSSCLKIKLTSSNKDLKRRKIQNLRLIEDDDTRK